MGRVHEKPIYWGNSLKREDLVFFGRWFKAFENPGHRGWPMKKILGSWAATTVNFGPFPIRFHVL